MRLPEEYQVIAEMEAKIAELEEKLQIARDRDTLREHLEKDTAKDEKIAELRAEVTKWKSFGSVCWTERHAVADELENWIDKDDHFDNEGNPISAIAWGIMRLRGEEVDACFTKHGTITFRKRLKGEE